MRRYPRLTVVLPIFFCILSCSSIAYGSGDVSELEGRLQSNLERRIAAQSQALLVQLVPTLPGPGLSPRASRATSPASPDLAAAQASSTSAGPGQGIATYAICRPGLTVSLDCVIRPLERPAQLVWAQAGMSAPSDPDRAASLHLAAGNSLYADAPE